MSEETKKALAEIVAAAEAIPEVKAFADGYKAGRDAALRTQQETLAEEQEAEE